VYFDEKDHHPQKKRKFALCLSVFLSLQETLQKVFVLLCEPEACLRGIFFIPVSNMQGIFVLFLKTVKCNSLVETKN